MKEFDSFLRVFILPLSMFIALVILGTFGYMLFDQVSFIDALQLVAGTISTCGLRQPATVSAQAKIFDIVFIVISFTVMITVVSKSFSLVVEGQLKGIHQKDKMKRELSKTKNHYIVCGFGRVGSHVAKQLQDNHTPIVAIDSSPSAEMRLKAAQLPYIIGTLSSDEVLKQANIAQAKGLVACADSDTENVFVVLSARTINPKLEIIARASDPGNEEKLKRAGADYVVSPYMTTGQKISNMLLNPAVAQYLEGVLHDQTVEVWFHEVHVPKASKAAQKTISQLDVHKKTGVTVLALRHSNEATFITSPSQDTLILAEDTLICLGSEEQIIRLNKIL